MGFKYINQDQNLFDADDGDDLNAPSKQLESRLSFLQPNLQLLKTQKTLKKFKKKLIL
jgi:hypothetical protein